MPLVIVHTTKAKALTYRPGFDSILARAISCMFLSPPHTLALSLFLSLIFVSLHLSKAKKYKNNIILKSTMLCHRLIRKYMVARHGFI